MPDMIVVESIHLHLQQVFKVELLCECCEVDFVLPPHASYQWSVQPLFKRAHIFVSNRHVSINMIGDPPGQMQAALPDCRRC